MIRFLIPLLGAAAVVVHAGEPKSDLKPLMAVPDEVVVENDFSKEVPLSKEEWQSRQGTRWEIVDGILKGQASSAEYQAKKTHHRGLEPRVSVPKTPIEFVAAFSVRFLEGEETAIVPFVEFGHHVCRMKFSASDGLAVVVDGESVKVAEAKDFKFEPGKWYHVLAEMKGDEFVVQFAGGPKFYARHACFAKPNPSGGNGLGIAGPRDGKVEVDNVTIWSVKEKASEDWEKRRTKFPEFAPVPTGKVKKEKPVQAPS